MRYTHATPHQYEAMKPFIDTLLLQTYQPAPLDIAVPHAASYFISGELTKLISDRFVGRMATFGIGCPWIAAGVEVQTVTTLAQIFGNLAQFVIIICDRLLLTPSQHLSLPEKREALLFDWWQWLRTHVDSQRLMDAMLYLSVSSSNYKDSLEFQRLGLPPNMTAEMMKQGRQLLSAMVDEVVEGILHLWDVNKVATFIENPALAADKD